MNTYKTAEATAITGIYPNTVRLYEKLKLIPKPERLANDYRVFTEFHVVQCRLVRITSQIEVLQDGLGKKIARIIIIAATKDSDTTVIPTRDYLKQLQQERSHAEEVIEIARTILTGNESENTQYLERKEASEILEISMDALRSWEMNGLLTVKRKDDGYRVYTDEDMQRLKIIRSLRCASYPLETISRLLQQLSRNPDTDTRAALSTPEQTDDIISVCDKLIVSLLSAERNANALLQMPKEMQIKFL